MECVNALAEGVEGDDANAYPEKIIQPTWLSLFQTYIHGGTGTALFSGA